MSTVQNLEYHHGVLRGFLFGINAPTEVAASVEALYAAAVQNGAAESLRRINDAADMLLKRLGEANVDKQPLKVTLSPVSCPTIEPVPSDEDKIAAHIAQHGVTRAEPEKPKRKHNMSPEARGRKRGHSTFLLDQSA